MKKCLVILSVFIFLLCSCSQNSEITTVKYFSSKIYVSTSNINFRGDFKFAKNGTMKLNVSSPSDLKNYSYFVKDNLVTTSFQNIKNTESIEDYPDNAPIKIIWQVMKELEENSPNLKLKDDRYTTSLLGYELIFLKSGYLASISKGKTYISFVTKGNS